MYPLLFFSDRDHDGGELLSLRMAGVSGTGLGSALISVLTLITWSLHVHCINYHMMGYHRCPYSILKSFRESTHCQVWSHHWIMFPMPYLSGKGRSVQHTATRNSIVAPTAKGSWSHGQRQSLIINTGLISLPFRKAAKVSHFCRSSQHC